MKQDLKITGILLISVGLMLIMNSCKEKADLTVPTAPLLTTTYVSRITQTTALSGGYISDDGGGEITDRGICWSTDPDPTTADARESDGRGAGSFTASMTGMASNTKYYVRAYAVNGAGTAYGEQMSFSTLQRITATDADGNVYAAVTINAQNWLTGNLKTTRYNDGASIPLVTDNKAWKETITPAYCWYSNDINNKDPYGALYNWYALNTRKLCPGGWHVATELEWTALINTLGGEFEAGGKLKSTGMIEGGSGLWHYPNYAATNEIGFQHCPGATVTDAATLTAPQR